MVDTVTDAHHQAYEEGFAQYLFTDRGAEELSDIAAKVNTWRIIPARARPKIANILIDIEKRATDGTECVYDCNCQSCTRRFHAWQEFDYVCQILVRNKEAAQPTPAKDAGPKVDTVIRDRVQRAISHGWKGLVEEYHAEAALRYKADLDRGPSVPAPRVLGEPPSPQDADAFCRNAKTLQSGAAASAITGAVFCRILLVSARH